MNEASANISVIIVADVKACGWCTLTGILGSLSGLYTNYDRNYNTLGVRGFLWVGDYDTRFLLLIDGCRTNNPILDQAAVGTEAIFNIDLIKRVERVSGTGLTVYGLNAPFGVINIIIKHGHDIDGVQASGSTGSANARGTCLTRGKRAENGVE